LRGRYNNVDVEAGEVADNSAVHCVMRMWEIAKNLSKNR